MEFDVAALTEEIRARAREELLEDLKKQALAEAHEEVGKEMDKLRNAIHAQDKADWDGSKYQQVVQDGATSPVNKTSYNGFCGKCVEIKISAQGDSLGGWVPLGLGTLPVIYVRRGCRVIVPVEAYSVLLDTTGPRRKAIPHRDNSWEWFEEWESRYEWTVFREDVPWEQYKAQMELEKYKRIPNELGRNDAAGIPAERDPSREVSLTGASVRPGKAVPTGA
jgi:hypothetical protein